ncbi:hypothetical protein MN116_003759, partial [Schistosoma mekongi]
LFYRDSVRKSMQLFTYSSHTFPGLFRNYHRLSEIPCVLLNHRKYCLQSKSFQPHFNLNLFNDETFIDNLRSNLAARKSNLNVDHMLDLYRRYTNRNCSEAYDELISLICQLPNFTHPLTPLGDSSNARQIYIHGSKREEDWKLLDLVNISSGSHSPETTDVIDTNSLISINPRGHLRAKYTASGAGPKTYYFGGPLAQLESALVAYTVDRLKESGFEFVSVPDILPEPVIRACGFPTQGIRSQIYKITPPISNLTYCLSGTSEMALAGFCAGRSFSCASSKNDNPYESCHSSALGLCAVSRCFRKEAPEQEPPLYRVHQFTKVEMFAITEPSLSASDAMFDRILKLQICLFADLGLHFRVLEMPSEELGDSACRKVDIETWMPGDQIYGEISSSSICLDYQSKRLNIRWQTPNNQNEFAYTLNGTACAIPRIMKALIETHQTKDRHVIIPDVLKRYMKMEYPYPAFQLKRISSHKL